MVLNWSFGMQHAITNNLTIDANYVGNHGQHLFDFADLNQPLPGANTNPAAENARRPYFATLPVSWTNASCWWAVYRLSLTTMRSRWSLTERASHGLNFIATYTYSHASDTVIVRSDAACSSRQQKYRCGVWKLFV